MNTQHLMIAPWVSWRIYRTSTETRCFLSNEQSRNFILLTDESAELFEHLSKGIKYSKLYELAVSLQVDGSLDEFISELVSERLLVSISDAFEDTSIIDDECISRPTKSELEADMIDWCVANDFLYSCHLDLTYRCNQRCIHCYNPNAADRINGKYVAIDEIKSSEIIELLDDLVALGVFRLVLSGGEVTLRPDFWEIFIEARKRGFCIEIYSNGLGIDETFTRRLRKSGIHKVNISVYSAKPELHDEVTGIAGSWQLTIAAFKKLREAGIQTVFKSIQMATTISGYHQTKDLGRQLGATVIMDMSMTAGYGDNKGPLKLQASVGEMAAIFADEIKLGSFKREMFLDNDQHPCGAGRKSLCISPDGQIYPCTGFPKTLGSIRSKGGIIDIWKNGLQGHGFLGEWRKIKIADFLECGSHDYCNYCPEVCAGAAWLATGNYLMPSESSCRQALAFQQALSTLTP